MATTRLRKAFRYPSESDSENDDLDEEHQEQLIASFQAEDAQKNSLYRNLFVSIPSTTALFFLFTAITAPNARQRVTAIWGMSSMMFSAYILKCMPIESPARKGKRPVYQVEAAKGPVDRWLVLGTGILVGMLLVIAALSWRKGYNDEAWREALPAIIFGLTMFVRQQLAPLDLEELQKARYELKGA